ncbi:MAG: hypothetical protein WAV82_10355 [Methylobacter sp.]
MNKLLIRATQVLLSGVLIAAMNSPLAQASSWHTAKRFMQGGTFCFAQGEQLLGGKRKTVKMVVLNAAGGAPNKIAHVDALMHGVQKVDSTTRSFFDEVTGAATIAPPNDQLPGPQQLQIGLTGTSYGTDGDITNLGVWTLDYAVTLSTSDLTGRITGVTVFNPVQNGILGEKAKYAVDETLKPIRCDDFAPQ